MAEGETKRVGKFTVAEEAPSASSPIDFTKDASKERQSQSTQDSVDPFVLKTTQARRRGKTPTPKQPVIQSVAEAPANYSLWAQLLIGSTNTVVVTWLGAECAMERREAEMLEPPIARILARLPASQAQKVSVFIDPMVILIAMGTWGNRIIRIQRQKRQTISPEELARASGMAPEVPTYTEVPVEPDLPLRVSRVDVNPNGVPVAITNQMGEV